MDSLLDFASVVWKNFLILDFLQRILVMITVLGPAAAFIVSLSRLGRRDTIIKGLKAEKVEQNLEIKKMRAQLLTKAHEANSLNPESWIQQYEQEVIHGNNERGLKILKTLIDGTRTKYAKAFFTLAEAFYGTSLENVGILNASHRQARLASLLAPLNKAYSMFYEQVSSEMNLNSNTAMSDLSEFTHIPQDPQVVDALIKKIKNRSYELLAENKFYTAGALARRAKSISQRNGLLKTEDSLEVEFIIAFTHFMMGEYLIVLDKLGAFIPQLEQIMPKSTLLIRSLTMKANCLNHLHRPFEAIKIFDTLLDLILTLPEGNDYRVRAGRQHANTLYVLTQYEKALEVTKHIKPAGKDGEFVAIKMLEVKILERLLRFEEGHKIIKSTYKLAQKLLKADDPTLLSCQNFLGRMQWYTDRKELAYETLENNLKSMREVYGENHFYTFSGVYNQAFFLTMDLKYEKALKILIPLIESWPEEYAETGKLYHTKQTLARVYKGLDRPVEAISLLKEILPLQSKLLGSDHHDTRDTKELLSTLDTGNEL